MSASSLSPRGSPPPRKALHERTPSQNNSRSPSPSIRLVHEKQDANIYTANPFPSKPNMVFLPRPGKGQSFSRSSHGLADFSSSPGTPVEEDSKVDTSMTGTWDHSSTVDTGNTSSRLWDDDPVSSFSSFPDYGSSHAGTIREPDAHSYSSVSTHKGLQGDESDNDLDEDIIQLPVVRSTVNLVPPELASDPTPLPLSSSDDQSSSPNVMPIGLPSSPNLVSLASSSPILEPLGSSSPNIVPAVQFDTSSQVSGSSNSAGTVIRTYVPESLSAEDSSSDGASSHLASFRSSPPEQLLRVYRSTSTLELPGPLSGRSRSGTSSSRGTVDSDPPVRYAAIRAPSGSGSFAVSVNVSESSLKRPGRAVTREKWNSQTSTVQTQLPSVARKMVGGNAEDSMPANFLPNRDTELMKTESTIKLVDDSSSEEHLDTLSSLPQAVLRHFPSFLTIKSASSRSNSIKSLCRPGSSSSLTTSNFPKWARLYYFSGETPPQNPLLTLSDGSRPPTATRPGSPNRQAPAALSRPRSRPYRANPPLHPQQKLIMNHPADPRSHWKRGPEGNQRTQTDQLPGTSYSAMSPHLHPDKGQNGRRNLWKAPSVDSTAEPLLGRRNIQKYSFCFGFIFPLSTF